MSIKVKARVRNGGLELSHPLALPDGEEVEVVVHSATDADLEDWSDAGMARLEVAWDNPEDSIYHNWRSLYGD
jgi:hypothetical protein